MTYICKKCGAIISNTKHEETHCKGWIDFLIEEEIKRNTRYLQLSKGVSKNDKKNLM